MSFQVKIYSIDYTTLEGTVSDNAIIAGTYERDLSGKERLELTIDYEHADAALFSVGKIADLFHVEDGWNRAHQIINIRKQRTGRLYTLYIEAEHFFYDLGFAIHRLFGDLIDQTPTTHLNQILSSVNWTVGTVTPTDLITVSYNANTILFDLRQIEKLTGYELDFTTTGGATPTKQVHLIRIGNQSSTAEIGHANNLQNLRKNFYLPDGNVIWGFGGEGIRGEPMTTRNHTHRVTGIASGVLTLDSDKIVSSDDTFIGYKIEKIDPTGFPEQNGNPNEANITDSVSNPGGFDTITVDDTTGLIVGGKIRILSPQGDSMEQVFDQASIDTYGVSQNVVRDETIPEVINLVGPAAQSALSGTYTAGLCEGWNKIGSPTTTENTSSTSIRHGTKSQKVVVGAFSTTPNAPTVTKELPNGDISGQLNGTYTYKIAWVTTDGIGPLSAASSSESVTNQRLKIDRNNTPPGGHVTGWAIFRIKNGGSTYFRIASLDNSISTFFDTFPDSALTIQAPTDTSASAGGQGVSIDFDAVVGESYAAVVYLFVEDGSVRVELEAGNKFPNPQIDNLKQSTPTVSAIEEFRVSIQGIIATSTSGKLNILAHKDESTYYIDAVMIVKSSYAPDPNIFIADNSATLLWYKCFDFLQEHKDAKARIDVDATDLHETIAGGDALELGDLISVVDSKLDINDGVRIVGKTSDIKRPWEARFQLGDKVFKLSDRDVEKKRRDLILSSSLRQKTTKAEDGFKDERNTSNRPIAKIWSVT